MARGMQGHLRGPDEAFAVSDDLLRDLAAEPYEPRGILNSEMALVIGTCRKQGINLVLESGRARGQSTYLLAKYLPDALIVSFERSRDKDAEYAEERLSGLKNVNLQYGDSLAALPYYVQLGFDHRVAVLLDGPKGFAALDLMTECFQSPQVIVGFIHDMRALDHGEPSLFRLTAEMRFPGATFSDNRAYVEMTKHLDDHIGEDTGWKPYHARKHTSRGKFEPIGSYGPTIGVFFNPNAGEAQESAEPAAARSGGKVAVLSASD